MIRRMVVRGESGCIIRSEGEPDSWSTCTVDQSNGRALTPSPAEADFSERLVRCAAVFGFDQSMCRVQIERRSLLYAIATATVSLKPVVHRRVVSGRQQPDGSRTATDEEEAKSYLDSVTRSRCRDEAKRADLIARMSRWLVAGANVEKKPHGWRQTDVVCVHSTCRNCGGRGGMGCATCAGHGILVSPCGYCGGRGKQQALPGSLEYEQNKGMWGEAAVHWVEVKCYYCRGAGTITDRCYTCNGCGAVRCEVCDCTGRFTGIYSLDIETEIASEIAFEDPKSASVLQRFSIDNLLDMAEVRAEPDVERKGKSEILRSRLPIRSVAVSFVIDGIEEGETLAAAGRQLELLQPSSLLDSELENFIEEARRIEDCGIKAVSDKLLAVPLFRELLNLELSRDLKVAVGEQQDCRSDVSAFVDASKMQELQRRIRASVRREATRALKRPLAIVGGMGLAVASAYSYEAVFVTAPDALQRSYMTLCIGLGVIMVGSIACHFFAQFVTFRVAKRVETALKRDTSTPARARETLRLAGTIFRSVLPYWPEWLALRLLWAVPFEWVEDVAFWFAEQRSCALEQGTLVVKARAGVVAARLAWLPMALVTLVGIVFCLLIKLGLV